MNCLHTRQPLPEIFTADELGDYEREFEHYLTETDIKTKVLFLSSNPKGYNIDKLLSFLSEEKSVYLVLSLLLMKTGQFKPGCVQCSIDNSCPAQELLNIGRGGILVV